jgi:DNA-binding transcriptional MerR regulator
VFAIGDFARHGRVSVRMLRHYDAIGLLRPAHVDPTTGYRSYRAARLADLNRIVALKDLGFTLEQVREMTDERVDLAQVQHATLVHRGPITAVLPAWQALARWVDAHGYQSAGPARELYLECPEDPAGWVTELQEPIGRPPRSGEGQPRTPPATSHSISTSDPGSPGQPRPADKVQLVRPA